MDIGWWIYGLIGIEHTSFFFLVLISWTGAFFFV